MMLIVISSSKRPTSVKTTQHFTEDVPWIITVPLEEKGSYEEAGCKNLVAIPENVPRCLSDQRQWIMEEYTAKGYKYIWLMDDDLTYYHRINAQKHLRKCGPEEINEMIAYMMQQVKEVPMVGISARFGNNTFDDYIENTRTSASYIIDAEVFQKVGAVFNPIPQFIGQDTHMSICFLNKGYRTRVIGKYAFVEVSGAPGGCATYRTFEQQKKCTDWFLQNHPETSLTAKVSKTNYGLKELPNGLRCKVDYNVRWKEAYKPKEVVQGRLLSKLTKRK